MFSILLPSQIQDFITILLGILVEALPFVILGSVVSSLISMFIEEKWIINLFPKNKLISHLIIPFLGIPFPVCECGNVPVAKRLFKKGLKTSQVITFILAAPAFNPVVFLSTYTAFRATPEVVFYRFVFTYIVAVIVGIIFSFKKDDKELLKNNFITEIECHHENKKDFKSFCSNILEDFGSMITALFIGATIASALQNFVPLSTLKTLGNNPVISIITMMIIAFVISICSNVDAFVALSYASKFTTGSIVSFLVFGPMIDIKTLSMLTQVFTKKFLIVLTLLVFLLVFFLTLILNFYIF